MDDNKKVRVRFAPSPTGPLHIGGVRTALYNYLYARRHGGTMILRIEDTDQNRYVEGAEAYIMESLKWAGIHYDEGPDNGGPYAPYRQSERKAMYERYAVELVKKGLAYYAFDTPEELEALRQKLEQQKAANTSYCAAIRLEMRNSLTLSEEETRELLSNGTPHVIRFKMPLRGNVAMEDLIRGHIVVDTATLDDKVLFKSDGMPTYHLANIVDDHLMEITHVIRGEEWLPSLPLHVMLYQAFGWEAPAFAHLPLLLKPDGEGKLSKRDGDRLGFPVFPLQWKDPDSGQVSSGYRESGYLPEAFVNILALLGWNPGTEQEIFSMEALVQAFSLERVGKSGARFDPVKARGFNQHYLRSCSDPALAKMILPLLAEEGIHPTEEQLLKVIPLIKERAELVQDFPGLLRFFFVPPASYDEAVVKKFWKEDTAAILREAGVLLESLTPFHAAVLEPAVKQWIQDRNLGLGGVFNALRLCLVGASSGPHLFDIMEVLGKEECLGRIQTAIQVLSVR
ncbi:MAG TPA: glutamate--tRNA ligase [Bacteroidales bacterium]|nr:glutamate--tRNA ligase [Bacteroidales bacterium]